MPKAIAIVALLVMTGATLAAPLPRASPEFSIAEPGKPVIPLSSYKGKVVVLEFLFVRSQHCMRVAQTLNKLHDELGARGFQPVGIVFDPPTGSAVDPNAIGSMSSHFKLTYPVGYASKESVDGYLGRSGNEVLNIPQVVVIDRSGRIRATSGGAGGNVTLEDESSLRLLIGKLLDESPATS